MATKSMEYVVNSIFCLNFLVMIGSTLVIGIGAYMYGSAMAFINPLQIEDTKFIM